MSIEPNDFKPFGLHCLFRLLFTRNNDSNSVFSESHCPDDKLLKQKLTEIFLAKTKIDRIKKV